MPRKGTSPPKKPLSDHVVGYGQPPRHSQFKPGQSGNPRGRPKGSADMSTLIQAALKEKVLITEGGKRRTITKGKAIAKQLVNKAASGDLQATRLLLPPQKAPRTDAEQTRSQAAIEPAPSPAQPDTSGNPAASATDTNRLKG